MFKIKRSFLYILVVTLLSGAIIALFVYTVYQSGTVNAQADGQKKFIKWVDFDLTLPAMEKAMSMDIKSYNTEQKLNWIELLAYLGVKYGGDFKRYKASDLDALAEKLKGGATMQSLTENMKYYDYYFEAYSAVLSGFLGEYMTFVPDPDSKEKDNPDLGTWEMRYGLVVYSPIARGYGYSHSDDFGNGRNYGFKRKHLGHDLMGSTGTPIIAVESGVVEAMGWNQYGGWRIGIRSNDSKRYYYYAHLRKDRPYHSSMKVGQPVKAGDVIGYLGSTGYSTKENVSNINVPHLHFGLQLIFDESQKEGNNEIWIDLYALTNLLQKHRSKVWRDPETKEYYSMNNDIVLAED